ALRARPDRGFVAVRDPDDLLDLLRGGREEHERRVVGAILLEPVRVPVSVALLVRDERVLTPHDRDERIAGRVRELVRGGVDAGHSRMPLSLAAAVYSSSVTSSSQVVAPRVTAVWPQRESWVPPCQWRSPGSM